MAQVHKSLPKSRFYDFTLCNATSNRKADIAKVKSSYRWKGITCNKCLAMRPTARLSTHK